MCCGKTVLNTLKIKSMTKHYDELIIIKLKMTRKQIRNVHKSFCEITLNTLKCQRKICLSRQHR